MRMLAFSVEHGAATRSCKNHSILSASIAVYRAQAEVLAVDMTISPTCPDEKCCNFSCSYVPETIEWE